MNKSVSHWARLKHLTFWMMSPAQWGRGNSYSLGFTAAVFLLVSQDFRLSCNYGIFVANVLSDEWEGKPCACLSLGPVCPMIDLMVLGNSLVGSFWLSVSQEVAVTLWARAAVTSRLHFQAYSCGWWQASVLCWLLAWGLHSLPCRPGWGGKTCTHCV